MLAVNYSTIRNNLKNYCDQATDNNDNGGDNSVNGN